MKKTIKRLFSRAALTLTLFLFTSVTAWAETINTSYKDADGTIKYIDATVITEGGYSTTSSTTLDAGWYVVTGSDVDFKGSLQCPGDLHLILADGAKMTVTHTASERGIYVSGTLTIYGQAAGTGELVASATKRNGIYAVGDLTINGGKIYASTTANSACAISTNTNTGNITINGGDITAAGTMYGINAGYNLTINGGKVHATHTQQGGEGLRGKNSMTLGYTNIDDEIYADTYMSWYGGKVKDGQTLKDADNNRYSGALTRNQITALKGKTLTPVYSVTYIDANGDLQQCYDFTVLTGSTTYQSAVSPVWSVLVLPVSTVKS